MIRSILLRRSSKANDTSSVKFEGLDNANSESTQDVGKGLTPEPILSVIVPCYKVEKYLKGTLDTILAQNEIPIEVIVVDDGSPDRSGDIAREYAANDARIIVISQENAGLGAARNTGIRAATGKYLTFADSDDYIPVGSYKAMVDQLEESGSDFVVGSVERRRGLKTWVPEWAQNVHSDDRIAGKLSDDPELLKDVFAWNKVFRRTFWDEHIREFPVNIRYEDQGPTAKAYTLSTKFDVLKRVVYTWVIREDGTSITQQKAKLADLQDRLAVMRNVAGILKENSTEEIFNEWLLKSVGFDLKPYYEQCPRTDDDYWDCISEGVSFLSELMTHELWNEVPFWERLIAFALLRGTRDDVTKIFQKKQEDGSGYQIIQDQGIGLTSYTDFLSELSFPLASTSLVPASSSLRLKADLVDFSWSADGRVAEAIVATRISGMSPTEFPYEVSASLLPLDRSEPSVPVTVEPVSVKPELIPGGDAYNSYEESVFAFKIDTQRISVPEEPIKTDLKWFLSISVTAGSIERSGSITGRSVLGTAVSFTHGKPLANYRYAIHFDDSHGLLVNIPSKKPLGTIEGLDGRNFKLRIDRSSARDFDRLVLRSKHRRDISFLASEVTEDELLFDVSLPLFEETLVGSALWELRLANRHSSALIQSTQSSEDLAGLLSHGHRLRLSLSPNGFLRLEEKDFGISLTDVSLNADADQLIFSGKIESPHGTQTRIFFESATAGRILPVECQFNLDDGTFTAEFELVKVSPRGQRIALAVGGYALKASRSRISISKSDIWIPVDYSLQRILPLHSLTSKSRIRLSRTVKAGALWLNIYPRVSYDLTSKLGQRQITELHSRQNELESATLFESFGGNAIGDSPLALFHEAKKRGVGGEKHYWTVKDLSMEVPEGAIPLVVHSEEYRRVLASARWLVNNNNFPYYFNKREGQFYAQTWHGTPLKKIGNDVPSGNLSISYRSLMKRESGFWDLLLAQNSYAAEKLPRAFGYEGAVLNVGYPRNDALATGKILGKSGDLRESLGISPSQHVILYAPTWRDNVRTASNHYDLVSYLNFAELQKSFGDSVVVLLRGHSNTVSSNRKFFHPNVIDVSRHPDINELMLASDSLVTDYSSIMFDYANLNRPIYVLAPDIEDYSSSTRGFYFEFSENLPGPLLGSTSELIKMLNSDPVSYLYRVRNYKNQFAPDDDGNSSQRVADYIWNEVSPKM